MGFNGAGSAWYVTVLAPLGHVEEAAQGFPDDLTHCCVIGLCAGFYRRAELAERTTQTITPPEPCPEA